MDTLRACVVQMAHGDTLEDNLRHARALLAEARDGGARLALLPEYFFSVPGGSPTESAPWAAALRGFFEETSRDLGLLVAGNLIERQGERVWNLGVAYEGGRAVLEQPKVHPMPREAASGVSAGERLRAQQAGGHPMGMLVCADILYPEAARVLALQGAEILLNPVMSPYREEDSGKSAREAIFVARAYDSGAFVLKAGGFRRPGSATGGPLGPPRAIAGRSLVAAPWGILARYRDDFTEELLFADLDFARLRQFRKAQLEFPARQPAAYRDLL